MTTLDEAFRSLFETNMGARQGERIVVFSDTIRNDEQPSAAEIDRRVRLLKVAEEAAGFARDTYGNTRFLSFSATPASGAEPPESLWRAVFGDAIISQLSEEGLLPRLLAKTADAEDLERAKQIAREGRNDVADVVVALANNSTSHTRFRALANEAGSRFASLPHFEPDMFFSSMKVNWHALAERTARLAEEVNRAVMIEVACPNGTQMTFGKTGRKASGDDGLLTAAGSFGNLPAGEVYLAPLEGTSEGIMLVEYAPTHRLAAPLQLVVRNGNVVEIIGDDPYRMNLEQKFTESAKNRNIAELGIGTNDRATRPDNILEAEKILGTIHIALGDNSGFGGIINTPFHEDYVFYEPTLTIILPDGDRKILLQEGTLRI